MIDTSLNALAATISMANNPSWVAITPDGTRAYVTNGGGNAVSVIDLSTNTVVTKVVCRAARRRRNFSNFGTESGSAM